jgi:hypothetical protein
MYNKLMVFVLACLFAGAALAAAPNNGPQEMMGGEAMPNQPYVYAFPGTACPVDSRAYRGPEAQDIKKQGAVYCVFDPQYVRIYKGGKCPNGKDAVPGDDDAGKSPYVWCEKQALKENAKENGKGKKR